MPDLNDNDLETGKLGPDTSASASAFNAHRPVFHLLPPRNWLNDPCAPCVTKDGTYRVFFQYTAEVNEWHKIQWGCAESDNLVDWRVQKDAVLTPNEDDSGEDETPYDREGVFTGCMISAPKGTRKRLTGEDGQEDGDESIIAYTSVNSRPVSPYPPNCETLSLAFPSGTTSNGRRMSCKKYSGNPILPGAPAADVIAWRDPFVREWASLDKLRGRGPGETLYGIIAGGYKDVGPALFLYEIEKQSIENWTYLGDLGSRSRWQGQKDNRWAADMRDIFEVANFVTLNTQIPDMDGSERQITRDFFFMSAASIEAEDPSAMVPPQRPARQQIFFTPDFSQKLGLGGAIECQPGSSGYIDRGNYYAMNTFYDPRREAVVAHAWITEDDISHEKRREQGWSGCLALPRTITLEAIHDVETCLVDGMVDNVSVETLAANADVDTSTILALRIMPCADVLQQLKDRAKGSLRWDTGSLPNSIGAWTKLPNLPTHTAIFQAVVTVDEYNAGKVEMALRHNDDHSIGTLIIFDPATATMTVDRSKSVLAEDAIHYDTRPEVAPHTLFRLKGSDGKLTLERLEILVIIDHSVVEIFVNGRTAITTRIYTGGQPNCDGISISLGGHMLNEAKLWHGIESEIDYI